MSFTVFKWYNLNDINLFLLLKRLCFRQNLTTNIAGLETLKNLKDLDLYDNRILQIENLDKLTELESVFDLILKWFFFAYSRLI